MKKTTIVLFSLLLITLTGCSQLIFDKSGEMNTENSRAQKTETVKSTGSITGIVTLKNQTGDMSGVSVSLEGLSYGAYTAADGSYKIENIPPGSYTLLFKKKGYDIAKESSVIVNKGLETIKSAVLRQRALKVIDSTLKEGDLYAPLNYHYISFNEKLTRESVITDNLTLMQGSIPIKISQVHNYSNLLLIRLESSLEYSTDYTFSYKALKGIDGGIVDEPVTIKFRTHAGAPNIIKAAPVSYSRDFPVDKPITIQFDHEMDPATLNSESIWLYSGSYYNKLTTKFSYDNSTKIASITPEKNLIHGVVYNVYLDSYKIKDINGVSLGDHKSRETKNSLFRDWMFETAPFDFSSVIGQWTEVEIQDGWSGPCFSFDGVAGKKYEIAWDSMDDGSGKYTISSTLMWNDTERHSFNSYGGQSFYSGYSNPPTFTINKTGKVYFYMRNESNITGTIAIKVTELP